MTMEHFNQILDKIPEVAANVFIAAFFVIMMAAFLRDLIKDLFFH